MFFSRLSQRIKSYSYQVIGAEVSAFCRYYDRIFQWRPSSYDSGLLFQSIACINKGPSVSSQSGENERVCALVNGNFNYDFDIEASLKLISSELPKSARVAVVLYNPYFRWVYWLANKLRLRDAPIPTTFVTSGDVVNLAKLSGYEVVRVRPALYCPLPLFGLGDLINKTFPVLPGLKALSLTWIVVFRRLVKHEHEHSLSIVIPARNEKGNIENAVIRLKKVLRMPYEVIFVEGHSSDGTWEEILRVAEAYKSEIKIKTLRQSGKGKNDAVRLGFSQSSSELLTILDADLTMPPELLHRFYDAYQAGLADFINGSRLTYPMEGQAMRYLNWMGNVFFAKALSYVLSVQLGDSLCGTKLLSRADYQRVVQWRNDFGDFDPFGDFELLFPAAILAMGVVNIPIRYRDRTYGQTNISRFRHGFMLLKMTLIGLWRVKAGKAC